MGAACVVRRSTDGWGRWRRTLKKSIGGVAMVTTTKLEAAVALRSAARRVDLNCIVANAFVEEKVLSLVYLIVMVLTVVTDVL
jgi:hypothetical protein